MKITIKLPGEGELTFEKKPMSEDARWTLTFALLSLSAMGFFLASFWMLR